MRAGIYVRISQDRTGEAGGVKRQEEDCRKLAQELGWEVVGVYRDNDVSASRRNVKRPEYERLWRDVKAGEIDAVLAYHPKRLYRRLDQLEDLVKKVEEDGVTPIRTVAGGEIDLTTSTGRAMARITATLAQLEWEEIGERVSRKKAALAVEGKPSGSRRPFGYKPGGMEIDEDEAEVYRVGIGMILNGGSLMSVVRAWNEWGRGSSGGEWTPNSVRRVLVSPRYAGLRVHQGKVVGKAAWPPIVTKRDHKRVRDILLDESRKRGEPGPRYLLTGLLECGVCAKSGGIGARMGGRPNNGEPGYVCKNFVDGSGKKCLHLGIKARPLEEYVTRRASELVRETHSDVADPATLSGPLLREREEIEERLERLGEEFGRGEISEHAFRGLDRSLSAKLAEIDDELEQSALPMPAHTYLRTLDVPDDDESFYRDPETRAWLETLIEKVVVLPAGRSGSAQERLEQRVELVFRPGVRDHRDAVSREKQGRMARASA